MLVRKTHTIIASTENVNVESLCQIHIQIEQAQCCQSSQFCQCDSLSLDGLCLDLDRARLDRFVKHTTIIVDKKMKNRECYPRVPPEKENIVNRGINYLVFQGDRSLNDRQGNQHWQHILTPNSSHMDAWAGDGPSIHMS